MKRVLKEKVLTDAAAFYDLISCELDGTVGIGVQSSEIRSDDFSNFDYNHEGDDGSDDGETFFWSNCEINFRGDGLYWKSESGKNACLFAGSIVKIELKRKCIKIWVAPCEHSDDMGIVEFYKL